MLPDELISMSVPALKVAEDLEVEALFFRSLEVEEVENNGEEELVMSVGIEKLVSFAWLLLMLISPTALREVLLIEERLALMRLMFPELGESGLEIAVRVRLFPEVIDPELVMLDAVMLTPSLPKIVESEAMLFWVRRRFLVSMLR